MCVFGFSSTLGQQGKSQWRVFSTFLVFFGGVVSDLKSNFLGKSLYLVIFYGCSAAKTFQKRNWKKGPEGQGLLGNEKSTAPFFFDFFENN